MKPVVELDHLTKYFVINDERPNNLKKLLIEFARGNFKIGNRRIIEVLNDVSLKFYPGEFVGIMGRNGVGKSTILKIISGIYSPTGGTLKTNGRIAPLLELGAGFAPDLSGLDNIFLNAAILGFGQKRTQQLLKTIIDFSELGDKIHMPVKTYSSGMIVRLGFSIAAHLDAEILLIDEILAVGDLGFQQKCLKRIRELHKAGTTIILVTHTPDQVKEFCSRCVVLENTRVIFDGPPDDGVLIYQKQF